MRKALFAGGIVRVFAAILNTEIPLVARPMGPPDPRIIGIVAAVLRAHRNGE